MISAILPAVILAVWWMVRPGRALWWAILVWVVALNLVVGAILSVLPIPILPFSPNSHGTTMQATSSSPWRSCPPSTCWQRDARCRAGSRHPVLGASGLKRRRGVGVSLA